MSKHTKPYSPSNVSTELSTSVAESLGSVARSSVSELPVIKNNDSAFVENSYSTDSVLQLEVTTDADSGAGSLREALQNATAGATITFASSLVGDTGQTIDLRSMLSVQTNVTIEGDENVTLSGGGSVTVMQINQSASVALDGLTIEQGNGTGSTGASEANPGGGGGYAAGGILDLGEVSVTRSAFVGNNALGGEGGAGSQYAGGGAGGAAAGAIYVAPGAYLAFSITDSFVGNTAQGGAGGQGGFSGYLGNPGGYGGSGAFSSDLNPGANSIAEGGSSDGGSHDGAGGAAGTYGQHGYSYGITAGGFSYSYYGAGGGGGGGSAFADFGGLGTAAQTANPPTCFRSGTHIATPIAEALIENLRVGSQVVTKTGVETVKWIGMRTVKSNDFGDPRTVWPIRVKAHAFASSVPIRDLWLSPEHSILFEDKFIPIKFLINGVTIVQEQHDEISYLHIELDHHNVLLAEGVHCESYLDTDGHSSFGEVPNAAQTETTVGFSKCEMLWETAAFALPQISGGATKRIISRLRQRAKRLSQSTLLPKLKQMKSVVCQTTSLADLLQPKWYIKTNPDLAKAGVDPSAHYAEWGRAEGRLPCPEVDLIRGLALIDPMTVVFTMPDVVTAGVDVVRHFCIEGWREHRCPNPYFDTAWYLANYSVAPDCNPLQHYILFGETQGLAPSRHFDPSWYRKRYALGPMESPLSHYLAHRRTQRFSPLPAFDVVAYCQRYASTIKANRDPYAHFLTVGSGSLEVSLGARRKAA